MWIKHPHTGRVELVLHEAHITRLLGEGGTEVPSPLEKTDDSEKHKPIAISEARKRKTKRASRTSRDVSAK